MASPDQLVRVVARPGGGVAVGRSLPGRGAWLCAGSAACLDAAVARKRLDRALRSSLRDDSLEQLKTTLAERGRMGGYQVGRAGPPSKGVGGMPPG